MNLHTVHIIKVDINHLEVLQQLGRHTFYESFAADNTKENMQLYLDTAFSEDQLKRELLNPDSEFYFAQLDGKYIGYLKINIGEAQTELKMNTSLEIERIYVIKEFHGKKVGQKLFEKALQIAKERKLKIIWLGVWEKNPRALRFYEKNGFVAFDKHIYPVGDDPQTDIMMKLELTA